MEKSRYTPLPGVMHGEEKSPIKHHTNWTNSTDVIAGHTHPPRETTAQPPKSPANQPLMKKKKY